MTWFLGLHGQASSIAVVQCALWHCQQHLSAHNEHVTISSLSESTLHFCAGRAQDTARVELGRRWRPPELSGIREGM